MTNVDTPPRATAASGETAVDVGALREQHIRTYHYGGDATEKCCSWGGCVLVALDRLQRLENAWLRLKRLATRGDVGWSDEYLRELADAALASREESRTP
jgi:hypothetical protein